MKPATLIRFSIVAALFAMVAAMFGAVIADAAGFAPAAGAFVAAGVSLTHAVLRIAAPGLFGAAAFMAMPSAGGVKIVSPSRALYDAVYQDNIAAGFDEIVPLEGYLRSEVVLGVTNGFEFPLRFDEQAPGQDIAATENRLRQNDAFYPIDYSIQFYTYATNVAGDRWRQPLQTFANGQVFGLNTPEVAGAYNGRMSLRVNNVVFMDSLDMQRFQFADTAQQGVEISGPAPGAYERSATYRDAAFARITDPIVRLNGYYSNRFAVAFPDQLDFTKVTNAAVVAVLYLRGWLFQNGGGQRSPIRAKQPDRGYRPVRLD